MCSLQNCSFECGLIRDSLEQPRYGKRNSSATTLASSCPLLCGTAKIPVCFAKRQLTNPAIATKTLSCPALNVSRCTPLNGKVARVRLFRASLVFCNNETEICQYA